MPAWVTNILNFILNFSCHIIPPAIFTFLSILYLPRIQKWALEKYLESRFDRKRMFEGKQREYNKWLLGFEKEKG